MQTKQIETLDDLTGSPEYESYKFGSSSDDWIHDTDRMERIEENWPGDGSTHGEYIQDFRECLRDCFPDLDDSTRERIERDIDECEEWHENNGSLHDVIG